MKQIKKLLQVCLVAFVVIICVPSPVSASGTQVIHVSGGFQTQQPVPSPLCAGFDDCAVDDLSGSFAGGTNRLLTIDFTETENRINYHDATQITTQYGVFDGDEYGTINVNTGKFHSLSVTHDSCGSVLTIINNGHIDLETLEDIGTYKGVLVLKEC